MMSSKSNRQWCLSVLISLLGAVSSMADTAAKSFYVDYSAKPNPDHLLAYDLSVIHPGAEADLTAGHKLGNQYLAYVSVVEIAADAPYADLAKKAGIVSIGKNEAWNSTIVDPSDPKWRSFVIDTIARPAIERGFDGFMLDTVDSVQLIAAIHPERAAAARAGLIELIRELRRSFPGKQIVLNRGFELREEIGAGNIDGVLVESVFHSHELVDPNHTTTLTAEIRKITDSGLPVYVVDYLPVDADSKTVELAVSKIREIGALPFISTPKLDGTVVGGGEVARRILVLFGFDPGEAEAHRIWPADTTTHAILQMPLEYMGYEVDYHDVSKGLPTDLSKNNYAGIILDEELEFPFRKEHEFADWLITQIDQGQKLLFLGSYGFSDDYEKKRIFTKLGIPFNEEIATPLGKPEIAKLDQAFMNFEVKAAPTRREFENVMAPEGSRVLLSLVVPETEDPNSPKHQFDTAYFSKWGGALLAPYVVFEASEETILQYADPFAFLAEIWPAGTFPAPDPTTRDGLRVFYTHVDGDGFSSLSSVKPGHTCAEVLRDDFIKDLPWPITISVIEAEIRGQMLAQEKSESKLLTDQAREIFRLPNVQTASHSYSHPYLWMKDDPEFEGLYDSVNMPLKLTAKYPEIDYRREIVDSLNYINQELAPVEKPAHLMLWSGNCRPSPEVLKIARENGFETMNGGNTILCSRFPGLFGVAPRVVPWDDELQIYASNQNEYLYTEGWNGPTWGGFAQVTETFEMTESPRRLKPVNVYYHFYSVERPDAHAALHKIYEWCRGQDLHAMTAIEFSKLTRDSYNTRLVNTGPRRWVALNEGKLRTFRIPATLGVPDMANSVGVTGFATDDDVVYIHTDGRPRVTLQLADQSTSSLPYLETASTEVGSVKIDNESVELTVQDYPGHLVFAGFPPAAAVKASISGKSQTLRSDATGRVSFDAPSGASISILSK